MFLLPCKQLWKTRKSVLQEKLLQILQNESGHRVPNARIRAVIVAGLEGTHDKVVWMAGHPEAMLQKKKSIQLDQH